MSMNEVLTILQACSVELDLLDAVSFEAVESLSEAFSRVTSEIDEADISTWAPQWRQAMEGLVEFRNAELANLRTEITHRVNCLNAFLREPS